ncbi:response regulator [Geomonas edaphica]|uniref:response regulator n=1 Tax=Geomonas edaphica TaxID=2570226 RepID=UPI0010A81624|nr:response regulator [Geomonas edaphica]
MTDETRILLVDDEPHVISALVRGLDEEPYLITGAHGGKEALGLMAQHRYKVVISDEKMPGMDGAEFLGAVKELYPETVRIMLTGHASVEATMRAVNSGEIYRFFTKPWDETELKLALRSAVEKYDLEEENRRLLRTVKRQSQELKYLEKSYPGITDLRREADGAIRIDEDVTEEEIASIIAGCNDAERSP